MEGDRDHKKYTVFDLCFALSFCLQNFATLLSVKTTEGRSLYVWISVLITGLHSKLFLFFLPCTSNHAPVIKGTDGLSWAFPIICAKSSKGLLPCQEFLSLLEYGILLPWTSVTGNICLYLVEITKGLSHEIERRLTYQMGKAAAGVDKPFKTNVITL